MVDLTVQLLAAKSGEIFGKGYRLKAIGQRLDVQLRGLNVPPHRNFDSARWTPPFHPEWLERFAMQALWREPLADLGELSRAGARVNQKLRRSGLMAPTGATSYGFRHADARRLHSPRYRVTDAHASLALGHTVAAHHQASGAGLAKTFRSRSA